MDSEDLNQPIITHTQNIVYDEFGNVILNVGTHVETVTEGGRTVTYKISENIQLADGHVWSGAQGAAGLLLAVCEACRRPRVSFLPPRIERPTSGLCLASNVKKCLCGKPVCAKHRVLGSDGHYRCQPCHWRYLLGRAADYIFWETR